MSPFRVVEFARIFVLHFSWKSYSRLQGNFVVLDLLKAIETGVMSLTNEMNANLQRKRGKKKASFLQTYSFVPNKIYNYIFIVNTS